MTAEPCPDLQAAAGPQGAGLFGGYMVELGGRVAAALDEENTGSRRRRTATIRSRAHLAVTRAAVAAEARRQGWRVR